MKYKENDVYYSTKKMKYGLVTVVYRLEQKDLLELSIGKTFHDVKNLTEKQCDFSDKVFAELEEYFAGSRQTFNIKFSLHGTSFQQKVWHELLKIPYGETRTYKEISVSLGNPKASRAVGLACHCNPIWIMIPCHRIVGTNGSLTGYAGGLDMKKSLLDFEAKNSKIRSINNEKGEKEANREAKSESDKVEITAKDNKQ